MTTQRERDVRNAIKELLDVSGAFDGVYLSGPPERRGERAGDRRAAVVEPEGTAESDVWDDTTGALVMTAAVVVTVLARDDDPQVRDETAELLLNTAAAVLNGRSLADVTLPGSTRIRSWAWLKADAPERRIAARLEFQYLVEGWNGFDLSE